MAHRLRINSELGMVDIRSHDQSGVLTASLIAQTPSTLIVEYAKPSKRFCVEYRQYHVREWVSPTECRATLLDVTSYNPTEH